MELRKNVRQTCNSLPSLLLLTWCGFYSKVATLGVGRPGRRHRGYITWTKLFSFFLFFSFSFIGMGPTLWCFGHIDIYPVRERFYCLGALTCWFWFGLLYWYFSIGEGGFSNIVCVTGGVGFVRKEKERCCFFWMFLCYVRFWFH